MLLLLLLLAHPVVTIVDWAGNLERRPETELFIFHHFLASTFVPLSTREFTDVEQRIKLAPFSAARYTFEQVCNMNAVTRFIKKLSFFATPHLCCDGRLSSGACTQRQSFRNQICSCVSAETHRKLYFYIPVNILRFSAVPRIMKQTKKKNGLLQ